LVSILLLVFTVILIIIFGGTCSHILFDATCQHRKPSLDTSALGLLLLSPLSYPVFPPFEPPQDLLADHDPLFPPPNTIHSDPEKNKPN
jgi:hypothetical protein